MGNYFLDIYFSNRRIKEKVIANILKELVDRINRGVRQDPGVGGGRGRGEVLYKKPDFNHKNDVKY